MFTKAVKTEKSKSRPGTTQDSDKQNPGKSNTRLTAASPDAASLGAYQAMAGNSPQAGQIAQLQALANDFSAAQAEQVPKKENRTGLPDQLKTGIEHLSGYSMDDVRVHYNSDKPAQLQALAYAQGTEIHVAPGQERHLPHEAWHVVQQMQGRVQPTRQLIEKVMVNDDAGLEWEADMMGTKAFQFVDNQPEPIIQRKLQGIAINSPYVSRLRDFQEMAKITLQTKETVQLKTMLGYHLVKVPQRNSSVAIFQRQLLPIARHREIVRDAAKRLTDPKKAKENQWIQAVYKELNGIGMPGADKCVEKLIEQRIIDQNDWDLIWKDIKLFQSDGEEALSLHERHNTPPAHNKDEADKWVKSLIENRIKDLYSTLAGFPGHALQVQQSITSLVGWFKEGKFNKAAFDKYKEDIISALRTGKAASKLEIPDQSYNFEGFSTIKI